MTPLPSAARKARYVNQMFAQIAPTYDLMNQVMTGGWDRRWRRELLRYCELPPLGSLLDVGTGTGDIGYTALQSYPGSFVAGSDFTFEMMLHGRRRSAPHRLHFNQADALALPFGDNSFDAVTSGFLLRNVTDITAALCEQKRVAKPGGKVVCLETTPPASTSLGPLFGLYFFRMVPLLGRLISGSGEAYTYLPHSTVDFPAPLELERMMARVGLRQVFHVLRMFGTVAIHVGTA